METIRCARCRALLFKAEAGALRGALEIKCRRCGTMNSMRPIEPDERRERAQQGKIHDHPASGGLYRG